MSRILFSDKALLDIRWWLFNLQAVAAKRAVYMLM